MREHPMCNGHNTQKLLELLFCNDGAIPSQSSHSLESGPSLSDVYFLDDFLHKTRSYNVRWISYKGRTGGFPGVRADWRSHKNCLGAKVNSSIIGRARNRTTRIGWSSNNEVALPSWQFWVASSLRPNCRVVPFRPAHYSRESLFAILLATFLQVTFSDTDRQLIGNCRLMVWMSTLASRNGPGQSPGKNGRYCVRDLFFFLQITSYFQFLIQLSYLSRTHFPQSMSLILPCTSTVRRSPLGRL